ncbi:MAG: NAD(P)/FAD-dependent oxidoreductase [Burkholderiaceae bacterium]
MNRYASTRRRLLAATAAKIVAPTVRAQPAKLRVVVVGGGFGGATCARYVARWGGTSVQVTLVEPKSVYYPCPLSNRVLAGTFHLGDLARDYGALANDGIRVVRATATSIDTARRAVALSGGESLAYDRLVLALGIEFDAQRIDGLAQALATERVLHAWQGGQQQVWDLRRRLDALRAGGVVAIVIPKVPFRCPPGPYERTSLIAGYLARNNPKAKLLVFDANPDIVAKRDLFQQVWKTRFATLVQYEPNAELDAVTGGNELRFRDHGTVRADVVNVIPPQRAPALARTAGLADGHWCAVDFRSYESTRVAHVHVVGDSIASAPGLPKSAHMANQTGKVCAAAIASIAAGEPVPAEPVIANTCYSFVSPTEAMHVAGVYRYDASKATMVPVAGAGGLSKAPSAAEGVHTIGWAHNILYDTFGSTFSLERITR